MSSLTISHILHIIDVDFGFGTVDIKCVKRVGTFVLLFIQHFDIPLFLLLNSCLFDWCNFGGGLDNRFRKQFGFPS